MTKNKFLSFLLATAFLLPLASCLTNSDIEPTPDPIDDGERQTVSLQLLREGTATRGVSRPICDGEQVQFNNGMLYLVSDAGLIVRYFHITGSGGAATNLANRIINIACLEAGKDIDLVPGIISRVVIVGNSQVALPTSGNINTVIEGLVGGNLGGSLRNTIASQHNIWTPGVNMFADATLGYISTASVAPFTRKYGASMTLAPLVARFEIVQMTGTGMIESYAIDGIFIDRYHRMMQRNRVFPADAAAPFNVPIRGMIGNVNDNDFHPNLLDYIPAVTEGTRRSGALFTAYTTPLPSAARTPAGLVIARPGGTTNIGCQGSGSCSLDHTQPVPNSWNFQVFARYYRGAANVSATTTPPAIVIRLRNVVIRTGVGNATQNIGTRYLTVTGFRRSDANNVSLTDIRASNAYRIHDLVFTEQDLTYIPHTRPVDVYITVEVARWNKDPIMPPGFNQPEPLSVSLTCGLAHTFVLGPATCGYCARSSSPLNYNYLWEHSLDGGATWQPAEAGAGNNTSLNFITPVLFEDRHFRRQVTCTGCGRIHISQVATAAVYCLEVDPTSLIFIPLGGTRPVTVTTSINWTVEVVGAHPAWLGALPVGNQSGNSFNVNVIQPNHADAPRMVILRVTAGALSQYVAVTQLGADAQGTVMPDSFVGAFWRYYQMGERLIRIPHTAGSTWTAFAVDDWIKLDTYYRALSETPLSMSGAANDQARRLPIDARGTVSGVGAIYFRVGLRDRLLSPTSAPRYSKVIILHNDEQSVHILWIRQGEAADYIMRPTDLMDNGQPRGVNARRIAPYNLTAPPGQMNQSLTIRGGTFTQYPSQIGAFFQWAGTQMPRRASTPLANVSWPLDFNDVVATTWDAASATHETCPPGYRRPAAGSTSVVHSGLNWEHARTSELHQSLFLLPAYGFNESNANTAYGFLADGFFDRRPRNISFPAEVASNSNERASRGGLMFNPETFANVFFPAGGRICAGNWQLIHGRGTQAQYWFATRSTEHNRGQAAPWGWMLWIEQSTTHATTHSLICGALIRCVRE